jgi:peptide chain release factor 3
MPPVPFIESPMTSANPVARRRTFAIISHPDAGKTTLTEKLLLFGGAIQLAGEVRAKANRRQTRSDWMGIERERGISVVTSVMTFEYGDCVFNLLDTPGHEDFSEDTYRTLTAVDSAVMVIDAAKGIEARTRKLFEVCRLRDIPIVTFINKMDRETRDPFDLLDEIEKTLALDSAPLTWTIGRGRSLAGAYDIRKKVFRRLGKGAVDTPVSGPEDPAIAALLPEHERDAAIEEMTLAVEGCKAFDKQAFLEGHLTPVLFGSALREFGVRDLIDAMAEFAPPPRAQAASTRTVEATEPKMTGFVFKIQANMDKAHRDRVAFVRICSGRFERGMKVLQVRTDKTIRLANPTTFLAQERTIVDEGFAGDVIGVYDPGIFEIGDTLTAGKKFSYEDIPSFAPEHFARVLMVDPLRRKQLKKGLEQLAQEGTIQLYRPPEGREGDAILGAVGRLQLEVVKYRLKSEYDADVRLEPMNVEFARWISRSDGQDVDLVAFGRENVGLPAVDVRGRAVALFAGEWQVNSAKRYLPDLVFSDTARGVVQRV